MREKIPAGYNLPGQFGAARRHNQRSVRRHHGQQRLAVPGDVEDRRLAADDVGVNISASVDVGAAIQKEA